MDPEEALSLGTAAVSALGETDDEALTDQATALSRYRLAFHSYGNSSGMVPTALNAAERRRPLRLCASKSSAFPMKAKISLP